MACGVGCSTCSGDTCITCKAGWTKNKKGQCVTDGSNNCDECEFFSFIALACFKYPLALLLLLVSSCMNANDTKELYSSIAKHAQNKKKFAEKRK